MKQQSRPALITILCAMNFLGAFFQPVRVIRLLTTSQLEAWYGPYLSMVTVALLICTAGIWMMKRRAYSVFVALVGLQHVVHYWLGRWDSAFLFFPTLMVIVGAFYFRKMD